ncbi:hypothetical protein DL239_16650 [Sedimentitalea sp. CY04]|uniref:Uncharacterized protein n=1 Tax=Parasedimentitalea denitrificans TaxID=2211118 RepID=A0ABX0WAA9_9RHOB|nr:hypothetical protein [Sedimentitalea sp. CY04]
MEIHVVCKVQINSQWTIKGISTNTAIQVTILWEDIMEPARSLQLAFSLSQRVSQLMLDGASRCFRINSILSKLSYSFGRQHIAKATATSGPTDVLWDF